LVDIEKCLNKGLKTERKKEQKNERNFIYLLLATYIFL
jgi:hypothetical protein